MTQARLGLSIIICGLCCWCIDFASAAEDPELDALLAQLRDSRVTYHASLKLLSRAKSDRKARAYIAERLPRLLESYGGGKDQRENGAWGSAAEVAGDLRVVAAVPILSRRIDLDTDGPGG